MLWCKFMRISKYLDFNMVSSIVSQDIERFLTNFKLSSNLKNARILITGATGLIGGALVRCLISLSRSEHLDLDLICPIRNPEKAYAMFPDERFVQFIEVEDLCMFFQKYDEYVDFIIHLASPTSSDYMINHPVETFLSILNPTQAILDFARRQSPKKIVYASSIEVYGSILDDAIKVTEDMQGYVNPLSPRSSYPMGKRAAECICHLFAKEYNVPIVIARLTQTFGAGISKEDNRVFAQMARSVIEGKDIVLRTQGRSAKPYCYLTDTISALLFILIKGEQGEAYNVANPDTYISIRDMGERVCHSFNKTCKVVIKECENEKYPPETKLNLDVTKLYGLGWRPLYNLVEMYESLIHYLYEQA